MNNIKKLISYQLLIYQFKMGRIKELMIGVDDFSYHLAAIYFHKVQIYENNVRLEKLKKKFHDINGEIGLAHIVNNFIDKEINEEGLEHSIDIIRDIVMRHNNWNDLDF